MSADEATEGTSAGADSNAEVTAPVLEFVAYKISRVHNKLNAQTAKILQDLSDITVVRWRIVAVIGSVGTVRMSQVAQMSAFDKGMLSRNVKARIEDGIVSSRTPRNDRRTQVLKLTAKGQEIYDSTLPSLIKRNESLIQNISDEEMSNFLSVLERLDFAASE